MPSKTTTTKITTRTTKTNTRVEISFSRLRELLGLPENVTIFVRVPGGGDWSNTDLEIDDRDRPLVAEFETVEQSVEETDE